MQMRRAFMRTVKGKIGDPSTSLRPPFRLRSAQDDRLFLEGSRRLSAFASECRLFYTIALGGDLRALSPLRTGETFTTFSLS